jgi:hypothetical protein
MSKPKKESFFWTSYSDLMTSLFFVMLVLFVLTIALLHKKMVDIENERKATQEQLDKITEMEESVKNIDSTYFHYDENFKRHTLVNIDVSFHTLSSNISDIPKNQRVKLIAAGNAINDFVNTAYQKNENVKYLLIIEGQSSRDNYEKNDELSFERALALHRFWHSSGVKLDSQICEVMISGSGQWSQFRNQPDIPPANQRFVIHIIPKTGIID